MQQPDSGTTNQQDGKGAPVRVLLVEDDEVIRKSVGMVLERYGYLVSTAPDGLTGLELFRDGWHDLLLLDVMLPHQIGRAHV